MFKHTCNRLYVEVSLMIFHHNMATGSAASTDSTAPSDGKAGEVKRKKKCLNKAKRKGLVSTLREIDLRVLVDEVVNDS